MKVNDKQERKVGICTAIFSPIPARSKNPENLCFPGCNPKTRVEPVALPLKPLLNRCREAQGRSKRLQNPRKCISLGSTKNPFEHWNSVAWENLSWIFSCRPRRAAQRLRECDFLQ
jgi:hypothetical protein